jgi:hypothetical protein
MIIFVNIYVDIQDWQRLKLCLMLQSPPTRTEILISPRRRTLHYEQRFLTAEVIGK